MKSAYELALERMEKQGIEPPRADALTDDERAAIADLRSRYEAQIAQLEIMHQGQMSSLQNPAERQEEEAGYQRERQRLLDKCEAEVAKLRGD